MDVKKIKKNYNTINKLIEKAKENSSTEDVLADPLSKLNTW
jgi:hypothetical protein